MANASKVAGVIVDPGEGLVNVLPGHTPTVNAGTWALLAVANAPFGAMFQNSSAADGDEYDMEVYLAKGTYTMVVHYYTNTNAGVIDIDVEGTEKASIDMYGGSAVYRLLDTTTGIVIAASGLQTITVRADGKNGSSSSYACNAGVIILIRTA